MGYVTVAAGVFLAMLSCGGEDTTAPPPTAPPSAPTPSRVTIEPEQIVVVAGDTVRLRGRVLDERSRIISDAPLTWASSDPAVATVDASGLVTGISEGHASITATSGPVNASAPAAVHSLDRATLMDLHDSAGGTSWTNRENWGSDEPVGNWYGVEANADARVTALRLSENGLSGQLPEDLGDLALLTELQVDGNEGLSGPIPLSLSQLNIQQLQYGGTMLCTVRDEGFQTWLNAIPTRDGEFLACIEERSDLIKLYEAMGGERWTDNTNWGTDAPLGNWFGIAVDSTTGRVTQINLNRNNLSGTVPPEVRYFPHLRVLRLDYNRLEGEIPPEIGELTELRRMDMDGNEFKGRIPPEIGKLAKLRTLWLGGNQMSGPIPPELGKLASLDTLHLYEARFDGSIPEEFGALTELRLLRISDTRIDGPLPESLGGLKKLRSLQLYNNSLLSGPLPGELGQIDRLQILVLSNNRIDGPIPAELGQLDSLAVLYVDDNMLSGSLPPELGATDMHRLWLQNNPDLSGPLPDEFTAMTELWELIASGTGLCAPTDADFRAWLNDIVAKWRVQTCGAEGHAEAYLTQATQSREFPVPLVAGERALLRVFVMSEAETTENIPPVRATFFVDGAEVHVANIPAGSSAIPTEVQVGELDLSANAEIPAEVIQPGLEMVVEVDPDGTVDAALGVAKRIPAEGRAAVEVREVPPLYLTLVPFIAENNRDAEAFVTLATPDSELFFELHTLLPVGVFEITKHPSVTVSSTDIFDMLAEMDRIRMVEEGIGHWMGLSANTTGSAGVAYFGANPNPNRGKISVSRLNVGTIAHELGHNLNLRHTDCGDPAGIDLTFPYDNARTGVWGYDPRDGGSLVPPDRADLMSYCDPAWVSDYYFTNALRFRLQDTVEVWPAASRALIVAGAAAADGALHLDPAFVVETTPVVPPFGGPYELTGRRADGSELFSLSFDMQEMWDGDGRSGFTFALPVQDEWGSELASLALTGPGGTVEMREGSEPPMAIMRDPVTGHVRAILRDLPAAAMGPGALDALAPEPGLDIMVSGGLPGSAAWRR
ncbi:leucine-rich repeat domain-containing protein [Candidatus Palauibacter sp.]|uniref:leucine-rich repeat domain-containing protein n=1 Tax=Candidatus Palauibacter sp. TaxID=3101350 RepID=UPI003B51E903